MEPNDEHIKKATAHHRGKAGPHPDKREKRKRTRNSQDRWARWNDGNEEEEH